ncbi:MAG TPA: HAD family phosphatase [Blastocatellia bacterium]|nr:HAD family phosphatase [Blastocatellia bacterium]
MSFQKAVIWDLDGTLIDSVAHHWEAWRGAMASEGFHFTHEQFVEDFGKRNDEILRHRLDPNLSDEALQRIAERKEELYRASVRTKGIALLPGVRYWLEHLQANEWAQALGTSAPRGNIEAIFDVLGIHQFFTAVSSSEDVAHGKPQPDVFLAAARKLNVEPGRCVVIEDAPAGIEAGRRAGMKTIGVLTTHAELQADITVKSLEDLPRDYFERLF